MNRDTVSAIVLLALCGAFYAASFEIRETSYGTLQSYFWPRIIIGVLTLCSLLYLIQSVVAARTAPPRPAGPGVGPTVVRWFRDYLNAIICFALFFVFLVTLDWIGMLLGGILFVFLALTLMGKRDIRSHLMHAAVAVISVGAMWALFTYAIGVILPEGELLNLG